MKRFYSRKQGLSGLSCINILSIFLYSTVSKIMSRAVVMVTLEETQNKLLFRKKLF